MTKHDGVKVDSILIDQAKFGEAVRQARASNFDLPVALGLQLADRGLEIVRSTPYRAHPRVSLRAKNLSD